MFSRNESECRDKEGAHADRSTANPVSLLIIEDALIHSTIIGHIANKIGFTTTTAGSYEEACAMLSVRQFDGITLDLGLGEHVGLDVLRHLSTIGCQALIVIISSSDKKICDDMVYVGKALDLNLLEPVPKPIDLNALRETLEHIRTCSLLQKLACGPV